MRVLAVDPGAIRQGIASLHITGNHTVQCDGFGVFGLPREDADNNKIPYHEYRLLLIEMWLAKSTELLDSYKPDIIVSEIVPVVSSSNFVVATQSQLAATAVTVLQAVGLQRGCKVHQMGATTIKKKIGGHQKATKVGVRNGVIRLMPEMAQYKKGWTKVFEEPDALAIGLCYLISQGLI